MNVARLALDGIERYGDYPCIYYDGRWYGSAEQLRFAERLATVLQDHGVKAGDRVVVMMANGPAVTATFHAAWALGAVIIPVTSQWVAREVRYVLENSGAQIALTSPALASIVRDAAVDVPGFRALFVHGESPVESAINVEALIKNAAPHTQIHDCADDDLAMLIYTSGTTGKPKGVMQSHTNLIHNAMAAKCLGNMQFGTMTLHVLPLSHVFGVLCMNIGAIYGCKTVILPQWSTRAVFETIEKFRVQRFSVVPTMLSYLLNFPDRTKYDTSSLEWVNTGGAATADEVRREFERTFNCRVKDGYGCSEATCAISGYGDADPHRVGSVGRALDGMELAILDDADRAVPPETEGEICVRGRQVMKGYWKDPETTRTAMRSGWLHTGDLGRVDADGYLYITGRKKDLIIKGGENISPREIEEAIYQHPAVAEAAVIGIPDPTFGEEVCAVVVLRNGAAASAQDIQSHVARFVTKFKLPTRVFFKSDLPKSPVGKILKRELRQEFGAAVASMAPVPPAPAIAARHAGV